MEAQELAKIIGENMREARERSDISVNRLAEISGLSRQSFYSWEGMGSLTIVETLVKFVEGFDLKFEDRGIVNLIEASNGMRLGEFIGGVINATRKAHPMTIRKLSDLSTLSKPTIIAWEKGRRKDVFLPLEVVSQATKIPIHYFFMEDGIERYYEEKS